MPDISFCLIVKNEANHLKKCLESFYGLYDELIIVDTGSTDDTVEIARSYGAKIFHFEWINDFSAARNFAISKASHSWIMMIDADDRLSISVEEAYHELFPLLSQSSTYVILLPYVYNKVGDTVANSTLLPRIWRKSLNLKYIYPIHEGLNIHEVSTADIQMSTVSIIHDKYDGDIQKSLLRNIEIEESYLRTTSTDLHVLYYLTHDSFHAGEYEKCIVTAEKYEAQKVMDPLMCNKVLQYKALSSLRIEKWENAIEYLEKAIGIFPGLIEPYLYLGDIAFSLNQKESAEKYYLNSLEIRMPDQKKYFVNVYNYTVLPKMKLAYFYFHMGQYTQSKYYAELVHKDFPTIPEINSLLSQLSYVSNYS